MAPVHPGHADKFIFDHTALTVSLLPLSVMSLRCHGCHLGSTLPVPWKSCAHTAQRPHLLLSRNSHTANTMTLNPRNTEGQMEYCANITKKPEKGIFRTISNCVVGQASLSFRISHGKPSQAGRWRGSVLLRGFLNVQRNLNDVFKSTGAGSKQTRFTVF